MDLGDEQPTQHEIGSRTYIVAQVEPLDVDGVRTTEVGTALWLLGFLALLPFWGTLQDNGRTWWLWTCLAGFGLGSPKHLNPGRCLAGTVTATGAAVSSFQVGDEVFGTCDGAFAEYVTARPDQLAPVPRGLTSEQAASMPVSGVTALQAVRDHGRVQPGDHVLVIGASGGRIVGTLVNELRRSGGGLGLAAICSGGGQGDALLVEV